MEGVRYLSLWLVSFVCYHFGVGWFLKGTNLHELEDGVDVGLARVILEFYEGLLITK
jgi:hypothetical protein